MKLRILLLAMAIPALAVLVAQNYKLVIRTNGGQEITLNTNEISKMEFQEIADKPTKLATPQPRVSNDGDKYTFTWDAVPYATYYTWEVGGSSSLTSSTKATLTLQPGSYVFSVRALPEDGSGILDSDYGTVSFTVEKVHEPGQDMQILVENFTHDRARITFIPNSNAKMYGVVVPASAGTTNDKIFEYIDAMPADDKRIVQDRQELVFTGLEPATQYLACIYDDDKNLVTREFSTEATPVPGTKVDIYAPGVSFDKGFIDVDKVGNTIWGSDSPLCWACAASAMCQWWLNDYKSVTGSDYPTKYPIPASSEIYSTPIMDLYSQAWYHQAGAPMLALTWFFVGIEHPEAYYINDVIGFNLNYEYVKGGWINMSEDEFNKYCERKNRLDIFGGGKTQAQVKSIFADKMLGFLRHGPVYFDITGTHALLCWGAQYTVQPDGSKLITKLYIVENDDVGANVINGMQEAQVGYTDYTGKVNYPYIKSPTIHDGGSENTGGITNLVVLRGWRSINK